MTMQISISYIFKSPDKGSQKMDERMEQMLLNILLLIPLFQLIQEKMTQTNPTKLTNLILFL